MKNIKDLTVTENIDDCNVGQLIELAKTDIVVLSFQQLLKIIPQRTDVETYEAVNTFFSRLTYLGFFQATDDKELYYIGIYAGTELPIGITDEWTQITDLRVATPHTTSTPWIVFNTSTKLTEIETTFVKKFFEITMRTYHNRNVTIYSLMQESSIITDVNLENPWYWVYGDVFESIPANIAVRTLVPLPGMDNTVLLVDRANNTHLYTFDPNIAKLVKRDSPRTVL